MSKVLGLLGGGELRSAIPSSSILGSKREKVAGGAANLVAIVVAEVVTRSTLLLRSRLWWLEGVRLAHAGGGCIGL
jgi:hypothetical protein